jgi:transcriptional regulator with XRE-family HTH domain
MEINVSERVTDSQHFSPPRPKVLGYGEIMVGARKSQKDLTREETERARELAKKALREQFDGRQRGLAEALDVSPAYLSDFLGGKKGAGHTLYRSIERLLGSPALSSAARRGLDDPYPSRQIVVELARGEGVAEHVLAALQAVLPATNEDPGEDFWQEKLIALDKRRQDMRKAFRSSSRENEKR